MAAEDIFEPLRRQMVEQIVAETEMLASQLGRATLADRVIEVMGRVPRHTFVPAEVQPFAYLNTPLPISHGKTISQPFIVALMTDLLDVRDDTVVLEIGTGFGYQAAILAELARQVYSVEIIEGIAAQGKKRLTNLGYKNIALRLGNGALGWPEHAPYDRIMVTAAPADVPQALVQQLKVGGLMAIPVGVGDQELRIMRRLSTGMETIATLPVRFVPMTGKGR